ncbi:MAG: hypothetical protein FWC95_00925 [Defluviitaleaceae bacterium]|nr:hypothetical protein [Defluviitaleaceae bacterium]
MNDKITALRMERQFLTRKANEDEYNALYVDSQPGLNVYWHGFGDPPSLSFRADFDDIGYNRKRQLRHGLIKGRFAGGNLGWIVPEDLELFAAAFTKPLTKPTFRHTTLLELIEREPLTIQQMKEETGMLVKEITPALHRLQEAFLIYEDQYDGEWDRGWHKFSDMFPDADMQKHTRNEALKIIIKRFAYRLVCFDERMVKSFYKWTDKDIKVAIAALVEEKLLAETDHGYVLPDDIALLKTYNAEPPKSIFVMHRNDMLVKANDHWLKERYSHPYPDTLWYLLIDGEFHGAVAGKFRYTPAEVEDVMLDLPANEVADSKEDILQAVLAKGIKDNKITRYQGEIL